MKKILQSIAIFALFLIPAIALAVNITVPQAPAAGYCLVSTSTGAYVASTTVCFTGGGSGGSPQYWIYNPTTNFLAPATTSSSVVIGTTTGFAKLSVQGTFGSTTPLFSIASSTSAIGATSSVFTVLANGNLGLGTSTPVKQFGMSNSNNNTRFQVDVTQNNAIIDFGGSANTSFNMYNNNSLGANAFNFYQSGVNIAQFGVNSVGGYMSAGNSTQLNFSVANSSTMNFSTGGNSGINFATNGLNLIALLGNNSSASTFPNVQITGRANHDPFDIASTSGVSMLRLTNLANAGFGTTTPRAKVHIQSASTTLTTFIAQATTSQTASIVSVLGNVGTSALAIYPNGFSAFGTSSAPRTTVDVDGRITVANGLRTAPAITMADDTDSGIFFNYGSQKDTVIVIDAVASHRFLSSQYRIGNIPINWFSAADTGGSGTNDVGITRASAGVLKVTDGSTGFGTISAASSTGTSTFFAASTTNFAINGRLSDSTGSAGTLGMVLQSTGTSTKWVATSTLGFVGGGGSQTPWTSNIDGAGYNLTGVNIASSTSVITSTIGIDGAGEAFGVYGTTGGYTYILGDADSGQGLYINENSTGRRVNLLTTTDLAIFTGAGNFGIGTSTPGEKLDVNGGVRAGYFTATSTTFSRFINQYTSRLDAIDSSGMLFYSSDTDPVLRLGNAGGDTVEVIAGLTVGTNAAITGKVTSANASTTNLTASGQVTIANKLGVGLVAPTSIFTMKETEHSSASASGFSLVDSANREVVGLAAWSGGGGSTGYGSVVLNSHCAGANCRLGEMGGKNTVNTYRLADILFETNTAADNGRTYLLNGVGSGAFRYAWYCIHDGRCSFNGGNSTTVISTPTAVVHLRAGTSSAGYAPLKFNTGSLLTTAEAGAVEFSTDKWYGTITTGAARKEFTFNDIALTSGRVPFTTTNGRLTDVANFAFTGTLLGVGSTTPTATLTAQGTSSAPTTDIFNVASSTGVSLFIVKASGLIGVGTTTPGAKVTVQDGDVYIASSTRGIILTSPDGTCARGTISNLDVLTFTSVTCP